ncbi:MAG: hypothetical protein H0V17_05500 [Deltaproteobacteria bacterium]|nr:hypothetical protein [Deltaproteobacteria bacterium]
MKTKLVAGCFITGVAGVAGVPAIAVADAPRGSSYATAPEETTPPVQTIVSEGASDADLRIKRMPAKLRMRPKAEKPEKNDKQVAAAGAGQDGGATAADDGGTSVGYKMFPTTTRDLRERVVFRLRAGVELDSAPASGETLRGGFPLADGFSDNRAWIMGDAVVGARGIITPALNAYFMSSFAFDATSGASSLAGTVMPYDNEAIAIKAGYAEYGREDRKPDGQQPKFWLRAGRQFRLDGGNMFAYFDGATVGYREKDWNVTGFAGQRAALYVDTQRGLLFGATAAYDAKKVRVWLDYMGLAISTTDFDNDPTTGDEDGRDGEVRHLVGLKGAYKVNNKAKVEVHARMTGLPDSAGTAPGEVPTSKFALGRVGGRVRYDAGKLMVIGDVIQRFKDDIAYDLAASTAADVVDVANKIGIMNAPTDATIFALQVDWQTPNRKTEIFGVARAELSSDPTTVDQKSYVEIGAGLAGTPVGVRGAGVYTTAQYTLRQFTDEGAGDGDMRIDGVGSAFDNSASSGIDRMHQLAGEAVLTTKSNAGKHWRFSAGAFFRVYDFKTPYRAVTNDARGGGRLDVQWWFSRDLHLNVNGELAQSSPTLSRDLGTLTSLRAALEARW